MSQTVPSLFHQWATSPILSYMQLPEKLALVETPQGTPTSSDICFLLGAHLESSGEL